MTGHSQNTYNTDSLTLNSHLHIRNIIIKGNKKTKGYLIEREMQLKRNDSIPANQINDALKLAKQLIYNTSLLQK
jgi:outer membrane protein assembly factor BamA